MASLLALSQAEFAEAQTWFGRSRTIRLTQLIAGVSALFSPPIGTYVLAVVIVSSQVLDWYVRTRAKDRLDLANRLRRAHLLTDALGNHSPFDMTYLRSRVSRNAEKKAPTFEAEDFYASKASPGAERLRDHLQESAFWTQHLYKIAAKRSWITLVVLSALVLLVTLIALPLTPRDTALLLARLLVVVIGSIHAYGYLERALAWSAAASRLENLDVRLEGIGTTTLEPVLIAFTDYSVVTACSPLIPTGVLSSHEKSRLNHLWSERTSQ